MSSVENNSGVYIILSNIPKILRSNQLRFFFSSFVESGSFICFHYIHRPEVEKPDGGGKRKCVSGCCIVKVVADRVHQLIETYNGQHWFDSNGNTLPMCCSIKIIKLSDNGISIHGGFKYAIRKNLPFDQEEFSVKEVESLREMRPPSYMPNGNVGTTTDYLLNELHKCRLPSRVIHKLGLPFPESRASGIYSNVAFDYKSKRDGLNSKVNISNSKPVLGPSFHKRYCHSQFPGEFSYWEDGAYEETVYPELAEWDRYQALQHHVYGQGTLYEEKIGLNWTEGGSGLVSHPYDKYWNGYSWTIPKHLPVCQEEFSIEGVKSPEMHLPSFMPNENTGTTSDHFLKETQSYGLPPPPMFYNFPMSRASECSYWEGGYCKETLYPEVADWNRCQASHHHVYGQVTIFEQNIGLEWTERGSGLVSYPCGQCWNGVDNNKNMRGLKKMKIKKRHGNGTKAESVKINEFAGFEKYNKGIGSKILQALGWKQGQGIGKNGDGIAEPLPNEGQFNKKGVGYQHVKSDHPPPQKKRKDGHPKDDQESESSNDKLKYQKEFLKGTM